MGFWDWIGRVAFPAGVLTPPAQFDSPPRPIEQVFLELERKARGITVSRAAAMSVPAVQKGRNMICSIATLPLEQVDPDNHAIRSPLLEQIDPNVANVVTVAQTVEDLLFDAVSWWRVTAFGFDNYPLAAQRIDPNTVSLTPPAGTRDVSPLPSGEDPRGAGVWINGGFVPARQIIRFDSPNPGVLTVCGSAIRRAVLFDRLAQRYANNPQPQDYFTPADGADPAEDDEIDEILADWKEARRTENTAYVPAALRYNTVSAPSPHDLQLVELQRQVTLELANALGVDPEDLGVSTTSRTYANAVDRRVDRINEVYSAYMRAITDRLSMPDVTKRGRLVRFSLTSYMRSNPTERVNYYKAMKDMGAMDIPEIRAAEGLPTRDDLTEPAAGTPDLRVVPDPPDATGTDVTAIRRVTHRFGELPTTHRFTFDQNTAGHVFAVDQTKRTVTGLALPYGKVASKYGLKLRFRKGALQYSDVSRVKHFIDHVTPIGRTLSERDTRDGKIVTMSVAAGARGDELLQLAEDGVYDGLSVGVDFSLDPADGDVELMPDGVYDVIRADWHETSTTATPAFDDARLTSVAASRTHGGTMPCSTCGQMHAAGVACPQQPTPPAVTPTALTPQQVTELAAQLNGGDAAVNLNAGQMLALVQALTGGQGAAAEQPTVIDPTGQRSTIQVAEAEPYRFDRRGNLMAGAHDFSTDLFAAQHGDKAAMDRATEFVRTQFDVTTGNVTALNPTENRPDLYVDQRDFQYPIWSAISKGTLANITPFTFPKFNSAAGLVAAHTEGTEPSSGTFTVTNQTVTPTAISGKAKITRETWDQGGNPQVSGLIWRQMQKGWFEALEAAAVAVLDAATPTGITLTTGGGTTGQTLDAEITQAFAALQYARGGFSMDNLFAQIDLYKALIGAKDSSGRRLYPAIGPNNAVGTVGARFGAVDINGVTAYPAWALAATGVVAASSYLFDSESVHGWASTPQRLDFNVEVANVYIGLWGYKATAISDIAGVREIIYDPA